MVLREEHAPTTLNRGLEVAYRGIHSQLHPVKVIVSSLVSSEVPADESEGQPAIMLKLLQDAADSEASVLRAKGEVARG